MLKPSLQLKLTQQLTMTPQLQQAIRLLQLPIMELQTQIQQALDDNVMLEVEESETPTDTGTESSTDTGEQDGDEGDIDFTEPTEPAAETAVAVEAEWGDVQKTGPSEA